MSFRQPIIIISRRHADALATIRAAESQTSFSTAQPASVDFETLTVFFDGGSRPCGAGCGIIFLDEGGGEIWSAGFALGKASSMDALAEVPQAGLTARAASGMHLPDTVPDGQRSPLA